MVRQGPRTGCTTRHVEAIREERAQIPHSFQAHVTTDLKPMEPRNSTNAADAASSAAAREGPSRPTAGFWGRWWFLIKARLPAGSPAGRKAPFESTLKREGSESKRDGWWGGYGHEETTHQTWTWQKARADRGGLFQAGPKLMRPSQRAKMLRRTASAFQGRCYHLMRPVEGINHAIPREHKVDGHIADLPARSRARGQRSPLKKVWPCRGAHSRWAARLAGRVAPAGLREIQVPSISRMHNAAGATADGSCGEPLVSFNAADVTRAKRGITLKEHGPTVCSGIEKRSPIAGTPDCHPWVLCKARTPGAVAQAEADRGLRGSARLGEGRWVIWAASISPHECR